MGEFQIRRSRRDDLERLVLPADMAPEDFRAAMLAQEDLDSLLDRFAWTWEEGGEIFAIFGCFPRFPGVGQAWAYVSQRARDKTMRLVKIAKVLLHDVAHEKLKQHRIEITVRSDRPDLLRFAEFLGFACEGRMSQFGPDRCDHFLLAHVQED